MCQTMVSCCYEADVDLLDPPEWQCKSCTVMNQGSSVLCEVCERPRLATRPTATVLSSPGSAPESGTNVGVFLLLRCFKQVSVSFWHFTLSVDLSRPSGPASSAPTSTPSPVQSVKCATCHVETPAMLCPGHSSSLRPMLRLHLSPSPDPMRS